MRIVMLTTSYPLSGTEASGVFIRRLVQGLSNVARVSVIVPDGVQPTSTIEHPDCDIQLVRYAPRRFQRLCHSAGGIPEALRRGDPALLFMVVLIPALLVQAWRAVRRADVMHGNWSLPAVIGAVAARLAGRPAVATLRGEDVSRARSSRLMRILLASSVRLNHRIFCVSEAMTDTVREMFPGHANKIEFIPNGIATVTRTKCRGRRQWVNLVTVGSCIERKRHELILRAMASPELRDRVTLRVIGAGPLVDDLKRLARDLGIQDRVDFRGQIEPERTLEVMSEADIFVLASRSEGRPNALMEAMACGLAVVASDIDGVKELVAGGRGRMFRSGDVDDLGRCLLELHQDPGEIRTLGERAQGHIRDLGLTWENCAERYMEAYSSLVGKSRGCR